MHRRARDLLLPAWNKAWGWLSSIFPYQGAHRTAPYILPTLTWVIYRGTLLTSHCGTRTSSIACHHSPSSSGHKDPIPLPGIFISPICYFTLLRWNRGCCLWTGPKKGTGMAQARTVNLVLIPGNFTTKAWFLSPSNPRKQPCLRSSSSEDFKPQGHPRTKFANP